MGYWSEITKNRQFLAEWMLTQGPPWFFSMGFNLITRQKGPKIGNWTEQQTRGMNKKQMGTWPRIFWKAAAGFKNFHCFLMFTILCCFQRPNVAIEIHREFFSHVENDSRYVGICFPLPSFLHYLVSSNILKPFSSPFEASYPPGINHETIPKCPSRSLNIQEFRKKTRQKTIPKSVLPPWKQ